MRSLLSWALRRQGYAVTECSEGFRMLDRLSFFLYPEEGDLEQIDLIISDIRMPGISGLSIVKGMRDCEDFPPVILITAFGSEETHAAARELGVAAMFNAPFKIRNCVLNVFRRYPLRNSTGHLFPRLLLKLPVISRVYHLISQV